MHGRSKCRAPRRCSAFEPCSPSARRSSRPRAARARRSRSSRGPTSCASTRTACRGSGARARAQSLVVAAHEARGSPQSTVAAQGMRRGGRVPSGRIPGSSTPSRRGSGRCDWLTTSTTGRRWGAAGARVARHRAPAASLPRARRRRRRHRGPRAWRRSRPTAGAVRSVQLDEPRLSGVHDHPRARQARATTEQSERSMPSIRGIDTSRRTIDGRSASARSTSSMPSGPGAPRGDGRGARGRALRRSS